MQESAVIQYKNMIELYGQPIQRIIDYLSVTSNLTFSTSLRCACDDCMSYQIYGTDEYSNHLNIYMFKNSMKESQYNCLKDIKENEIIFIYEMREYRTSIKEERFRYFTIEKYDDITLLLEYSSNYTILGKNHSVINTPTISQNEVRVNCCEIFSELKRLF